jgi:hypothetical protein
MASIVRSAAINPANNRIDLRARQGAVLWHCSVKDCGTDGSPGIKYILVSHQGPGSINTSSSVTTAVSCTGGKYDRAYIRRIAFRSTAIIRRIAGAVGRFATANENYCKATKNDNQSGHTKVLDHGDGDWKNRFSILSAGFSNKMNNVEFRAGLEGFVY